MPPKPHSAVYLIDGSAYVFRAYHAIQHLSNSAGTPTNAVFGVTRMLLKLLEDEDPGHVVVVMDAPGKTFRHETYPDYKANRPPPPEDLAVQFELVRRAIRALNLPMIEKAGYEADDLIGTLAGRALERGFEVVIVSGDKDLMQLVGDEVCMLDPMKERRYDADGVRDKLGVAPGQVCDLLGLMGDSSDNIPGIKGVGQKTAAKLLGEHPDLEAVLAAAKNMRPTKLRERLLEHAELARLSKRLATIATDVELGLSIDDLARKPPDLDELDAFLAEMEFMGLRRELVGKRSIDTRAYRSIHTPADLERLVARIRQTGELALDLETDSLASMRAGIVGIALCPAEGEAAYLPVRHTGDGAQEQIDLQAALELLRPVLCEERIARYGQNLKYDALILRRHGLELGPIAADSMLISYMLDPERPNHGLDYLARDLLGHTTIAYADVTGKGKDEIPFAEVSVERATEYAGEDADVAFRLCKMLLPRLDKAGLTALFRELELPLIRVLMDMEQAGVLVDRQRLQRLSAELEADMQRIEARIHELAGHDFNVNSPTQLRVILFEELELPVVKRTKSGPSTDQSVLEELAAEHELPAEILEYRQLAKLKSTYADVLPQMIHPQTGRIHTSFHQTVAATGRLSSSDPNLQNIPVRTPTGRRIREAFVAPVGFKLLSADYSQVELRILAHLSADEALLDSFRSGEDVHARTASRVFGVPLAKVTSEMRTRAKAVNFGIVYGQSAFALARQLRIGRDDAEAILSSHREQHPGIYGWIERIHQQARAERCVFTLFGRRRFLPDIHSRNFNARSNAERIAQNTPIQGTAADIIKRAMLAIRAALAEGGLKTRMILQVHDELIFEAPDGELDLLEKLVRDKMEHAAELDVPLTVDVGVGDSWAEVH
ncbi:MAG: DNA polymerase I [Deltaproteobacteria bacterium]|nr:DNA polymerase I [Deltaproteobacteria bacterium]